MRLKSNILKIALFTTGLSGIVAEYMLSTLATYFLGDSVFQWTMIVSVMLFSMGLGSHFTKYLKHRLLQKFIFIEYTLSILTAFATLIVYIISAYTIYTGFIIYVLSITIGVLIGMEIPLAIRLNDEFENLRVNVSSIMEKDYFGSLAGGLFYSFVGLPILGLTYSPFILGSLNFLVAVSLLYILWKYIKKREKSLFAFLSAFVFLLLFSGFFFAKPIIMHGEQKKYQDKIIYSEQSKYQKIIITQWKDNYWLYLDGNQQLSSIDEVMYHEPLVHPAMSLTETPYDILILGGGDGCAAREVLKHNTVKSITLVDLDPAVTKLGETHDVLVNMNGNSLKNKKVNIVNEDGFLFVEKTKQFFDVIIIDLPDPRTVELGRLYSYEFYKLCGRVLRPNGALITQAGSPYYATKSFKCIEKTINAAGFSVIPMHNQIVTMGEWGWIIGKRDMSSEKIKQHLLNQNFQTIETQWINKEAMQLLTSFGKQIYPGQDDSVEVNKIHNPVLYKYYLNGNWDLY